MLPLTRPTHEKGSHKAVTTTKLRQKRTFPISPLWMIFLGILLLICLFPDFFANHDPLEGNLREAYRSPDDTYYCGTDVLGRDIFSRMIYGIRLSLSLSLTLVSLIVVIGTSLGVLGAYLGGFVDIAIMSLSNILISCPSMVLAIALAGILGASVENALFAIFVVSISKYIRLARSLVIQVRNEDFVISAQIGGAKPLRVLLFHVLPNILPTLLVTATTDLGTVILELSALSFLGFGVPDPLPELGLMMNQGRPYLLKAPWMVFCPGCAIFAIVSIANIISDQFRDWLDQ